MRQHADGRTIVYGVYDYDSAYQNERNESYRHGAMLDANGDVPATITRVASMLADDIGDSEYRGHMLQLAQECIADLPAVDLDGPASLEALLVALNTGNIAGLPMKHGEVDMASLPTFGGEEPTDTSGVWSYDETRLLVGDAAPFRIVPRTMPLTIIVHEDAGGSWAEVPSMPGVATQGREGTLASCLAAVAEAIEGARIELTTRK